MSADLAMAVMRLSVYANQWRGHASHNGQRAADIALVLEALADKGTLPPCKRSDPIGCVRPHGHFGHCVSPRNIPVHSSNDPQPCPECGVRIG